MEQFLLLGANPITGFVNDMMQRLLLWIDSGVYKLVAMSYQLFVYLSSAQIFSNEFFENFALRIYAILGVFMLFYLGYALLNAIVDPDKNLSGEKGAGKIAFNLVKALVLIGLLPTVFSYAMRLQNFILSENIIGTIILGTTKEDTDDALVSFGDKMSFTAMHAFINPDDYNVTMEETGRTWDDMVNNELLTNSDYSWLSDLAPWIIYDGRLKEDGKDVKVKYLGIISTITGIILVYIILSFTLDLGVRVVKLAFCQLIAPIPIVLGIIPSRKSTMDKWVKLTLSTYFEVFVRVAIMYLLVYFMSQFGNTTLYESWRDGWLGKFAIVVIMLGLFAFAKQLPKLISDTLGLDTSSIKFRIGDKLKASGPLGNLINNTGRAVGGAAKGVGLGIGGAATGALGAGWTAAMNGGSISNALRYGAFKGFKGKGNQFGAMRQSLYKDVYSLDGTAGWFGGKNWFEQQTGLAKSKADNQFRNPEKGANKAWLDNYERTNSSFVEKFNAELLKQNQELDDRRKSVGSRLINLKANANTERKNLADATAALKAEQDKLESERSTQIANLRKRIIATKNPASRDLLMHDLQELESKPVTSEKLQSLQSSVQNAQNIVDNINTDLANTQTEYDSIVNKRITETDLRANESAMDDIRSAVMKEDPTYKSRLTNLRNERIEKEANKRQLDDAVEEELWARRFKKAGFEKKDASGGSKSSSSSGDGEKK